MQAIVTKYIGPGNVRGARMKATAERGSITIPYPDQSREAHRLARAALVAKFVKEDEKRYGTNENPWAAPRVTGVLPNSGGHECHCTVDLGGNQVLIEFADDDDYNAFKSYLEEVRNQEGSASPLRNGLMSSALRRAKIGGVR